MKFRLLRPSTLISLLLVIGLLTACSLAIYKMASDLAMNNMEGMANNSPMQCCTLQPFAGVDSQFDGITLPVSAKEFLALLLVAVTFLILGRNAESIPPTLRGQPMSLQWLRFLRLRQSYSVFQEAFSRGILHPQLYEPASVLN